MKQAFSSHPSVQPTGALGRLLLALLLTAVVGLAPIATSDAQAKAGKKSKPAATSQPAAPTANPAEIGLQPPTIIGAQPDSADVKSLLEVHRGMLEASNRHDLQGVLRYYSPSFISGDNLRLEQVRHLIEDTWKIYPNIAYVSRVLEVRLNGDWATVETADGATAPTKAENLGNNAMGMLRSQSRGLLYFHRIGNSWEITSDYTLYEKATILFGETENLGIDLTTPDQVFAGENYTARIQANLPDGSFAIASIAKDPIVYPQGKPKDRFRTITPDRTTLERVFEANTSNHNEIITATLGLTQIEQGSSDRPSIRLKAVATLVKRVNVLPRVQAEALDPKGEVVRRSASGAIDLSQTKTSADGDDEEGGTESIEQAPVNAPSDAPGQEDPNAPTDEP
jgi:hypothetical protein